MVDLPPTSDESIGALLSRLVDDARVFVRAEIALYRAQIIGWIGKAKAIAILAILALMLVNVATIALFVGLLLTLARSVGPGWATVIVVFGTLAIAALLGWLATVRIRKLLAARTES